MWIYEYISLRKKPESVKKIWVFTETRKRLIHTEAVAYQTPPHYLKKVGIVRTRRCRDQLKNNSSESCKTENTFIKVVKQIFRFQLNMHFQWSWIIPYNYIRRVI